MSGLISAHTMEQKEQFIPFLFEEPVYLIQNTQSVTKAVSAPSSHFQASPSEDTQTQIAKKKLIVFCNEATPDELAFLSKILDAIKLTPADYHIETGPLSLAIASNKLLYFGQHPQTGTHTMYELLQIDNQIVLSADSLNVLQHDVSRKKLLWTALQKMFS